MKKEFWKMLLLLSSATRCNRAGAQRYGFDFWKFLGIENNMKKISLFIVFILITIGCTRYPKRMYIYTPNKNQCITVFNLEDYRYLCVGEVKRIPESNYIKLDVSRIDEIGDGIHILWKKNGWDVVVRYSILIESTLDTTCYKFSNKLPIDDKGFSTEEKFRQDSAAIFDYYLMQLSPQNGFAVIEY